MFGHVAISSLRLNASLYLNNMSITFIFSSLFKHEFFRSMYFSNISLSIKFLLSSSRSNHGYLSVCVCSLSFFKVSMNLLNIHRASLLPQIYNTWLDFAVICLFDFIIPQGSYVYYLYYLFWPKNHGVLPCVLYI